MAQTFFLLALNPGSSSTKIGVFENEKPLFAKKVKHDEAALGAFKDIADQKAFRKQAIFEALSGQGFDPKRLSAVVGRGGLLRPLESGTYRVNEAMLADLKEARRGKHASNLGAMIAHEIASQLNVPAFIVDPVSVDEWEPVARLSGLEGLDRECLSHALNTKAVAKRFARENNRKYNDLRLIVAHLGSGISVSAHLNGRMVDVTNPMEEGAFSTERSGSLPILKLAKMCFSGKHTFQDIEKMTFRSGGLASYLGTKELPEVTKRITAGDEKAKLVLEAMAYQVAKEIGAMATVLSGKADAVLLTGGMAHEAKLCEAVEERVKFIAGVYRYPGEDELVALAEGALRVLTGEEKEREY
jgi:butyrate kinase